MLSAVCAPMRNGTRLPGIIVCVQQGCTAKQNERVVGIWSRAGDTCTSTSAATASAPTPRRSRSAARPNERRSRPSAPHHWHAESATGTHTHTLSFTVARTHLAACNQLTVAAHRQRGDGRLAVARREEGLTLSANVVQHDDTPEHRKMIWSLVKIALIE